MFQQINILHYNSHSALICLYINHFFKLKKYNPQRTPTILIQNSMKPNKHFTINLYLHVHICNCHNSGHLRYNLKIIGYTIC